MAAHIVEDGGMELGGLGDEGGKGDGRNGDLESSLNAMLDGPESSDGDGDEVVEVEVDASRGRAKERETEKRETLSSSSEEEELTDDSDDGSGGPVLLTLPL
jgi:hypothetical protein